MAKTPSPREKITIKRLKEGDEVWLRAKVTKTGVVPSYSAVEHIAVRIDGVSTPVLISENFAERRDD